MSGNLSVARLRIRTDEPQAAPARRFPAVSSLLGSSRVASFSERFEASVAEAVSKAHEVLRMLFSGASEDELRDKLDSLPVGYLDADAMDMRDGDGMGALHWCG